MFMDDSNYLYEPDYYNWKDVNEPDYWNSDSDNNC